MNSKMWIGVIVVLMVGIGAALMNVNSFRSQVPATGSWVNFRSDESKFSAVFPKEPEVKKQVVATTVGNAESREYSVVIERGNASYSVGHIAYPEGTVINEKQAFEGVLLALVTQYRGVMDLQGQKEMKVGSYPALEVVFQGGENLEARVWTVVAGQNHYQVSVSGREDFVEDAATKYFLESFKPD